MKLLALGDVVGAYGTHETAALLPRLRRETGADFVVVNAENAAPGNGTDPASAELLLASGADVLTGGNHTLRRYDFFDMLNEHDCVLRPLNYPPAAPGKGFTILRGPEGLRILVLSLCGQVFMGPADNPFTAAERLLAEQRGRYDVAVADLHAEATSEKLAFAHRFDGEIQIMFGTHTHVQTADEQLLDKGSGYITDLGMCGDAGGVLGVKSECVVSDFTTKVHMRFEGSEGNFAACGALFTLDTRTRCVTDVKRIRTCKNGTVMV